MTYDALAGMVDKTFAFSLSRTFSREEAEELTQEILFQAVKSLNTLQDDEKFEQWYWQLANNTLKAFRRGRARLRDWFSYDEVTLPPYEDDYAWEKDQEYQELRKKIAFLSAAYRDIVVMHYYNNLTCREIARRLGIPEGTVTYRLSIARHKLQKECGIMNPSALKPIALEIRISGEGSYNGADRPFPWQYISDALSQNILWHAYREPKSVEELAELTGVPAFYIEDSLANLIKREAVIQPTKNTVQTNFLIFDDPALQYGKAHAGKLAQSLSAPFYQCAQALTEQTLSLGVATAEKPFDELLCLFSLLALDESVSQYPPSPFEKPPVRYDGNIWEYRGNIPGAACEGGLGMNKNLNRGVPASYSHYVYSFSPFQSQKMMYDHELAVCAALLQGKPLTDKEKETAAQMLAAGYLRRKGEEIAVSMPVFTAGQYEAFKALVRETFSAFFPLYQKEMQRYVGGYVSLFPRHLKAAAERNGFYLFVSMFTKVVSVWLSQGNIHIRNGAVCDVLIGHSE